MEDEDVVDDDDDVVVEGCDVVVGGGGGGIVDGGGGGGIIGSPMAGSGLATLPKMRFFKRDAVKAIPNTGMIVSRSSLLCLAVSSTNWSNVSSAASNSKVKQIPNARDTATKAEKNLMLRDPYSLLR